MEQVYLNRKKNNHYMENKKYQIKFKVKESISVIPKISSTIRKNFTRHLHSWKITNPRWN